MKPAPQLKAGSAGQAWPRPSVLPAGDREVLVLGAGGHAKVILSLLAFAGAKVAGIYDDDPAKRGTMVLHIPVLGTIGELHDLNGHRCVIGVGDNHTRQHIATRFPAAEWLTLVHPRSYVDPFVSLGEGTVVVAGAVVQPGARIGSHCIINTAATMEQDCVIADFCHVAPGCSLGRNVNLAEGVFMGIGSVAATRTHVGAWTMIGAGAVVANDLPDHVLAVGVPARIRRPLHTP